MQRKILSIGLAVILTAFIAVSLVLVNQKIDISSISKSEQIACYSKPAIVRIIDGAAVSWKYEAPSSTPYELDAIINKYLQSKDSVTSLIYEGSGAIISPDGYIVTNSHVVMVSKQSDDEVIQSHLLNMEKDLVTIMGLDQNDDKLMSSFGKFLSLYVKPQGIKRYKYVVLPGNDWVQDEIKSCGASTGEGKDVAVLKIEKNNLPSLIIGDSDKVNLEDNIWVCGYPAAADSNVLSKESIFVSTINPGNVTAIDKKTEQGMPVLQVNAAATHGNSGGPVLNANGSIVGLLTFNSEQNTKESQGFNFVVPSNTVKEFVAQAGAKNSEGQVSGLYKEGLKLYWGGYYKDALVDFQAVQNMYPNHSETKKLIATCQAKSDESKILWSKYKSLVIKIDIVLGVIAVLSIFFGLYGFNKNKIKAKISNKTDD